MANDKEAKPQISARARQLAEDHPDVARAIQDGGCPVTSPAAAEGEVVIHR